MPLSIDRFNKLILVTSPTTSVDAQTLHDFVQDYMATPSGMVLDGSWDARGEIMKPEGKIEDLSNPGIFSQIIIILNPEWQIQFWQGSGYTRIFGGKIVGGLNDQPLKATGSAGDISVLQSPVDGVTAAVGSGLDTGQDEKLTALHQAHYNRRLWDKNGDTITVYDEDGTTPLHVFDTNSDMSEITPQ